MNMIKQFKRIRYMALMASPYEGIDMPLICVWSDVTSGGVEIVL